jgi:hypothetical protein
MVAITISNDHKSLKYIYIASIFGCVLLWITVYTPTFNLSRFTNNLQQGDDEYMAADDEYNSIAPITPPPDKIDENNTKQALCTSETFNQGKWIYDPLNVEDPHSADQIAKAAGYHCTKKFAHRCFRRPGDAGLRAKKMYGIYLRHVNKGEC